MSFCWPLPVCGLSVLPGVFACVSLFPPPFLSFEERGGWKTGSGVNVWGVVVGGERLTSERGREVVRSMLGVVVEVEGGKVAVELLWGEMGVGLWVGLMSTSRKGGRGEG